MDNAWFPLKTGDKWIFKQASIQSKISGDTEPKTTLQESKVEFEIIWIKEIGSKEYFVYQSQDGYRKKIIRFEDGNYFINDLRTADQPDREFIFLRNNLSLGESWIHEPSGGNSKIVFTVVKLEKSITINGQNYQDTIEINRDYYNKTGDSYLPKSAISKHIYAKGIGEVYSYIPYPLGGIYADDELQLEKFIPFVK